MRLLLPAPSEMFPWLATRASLTVGPGFHALAALDDVGHIAGMVGYDGFTKNSCSMHVAIEKPMAVKTLIRAAFEIPFCRLGLGVVFGTVISSNTKSLKLDKHLGFTEVARLKDHWDQGVDLVLLEMRRENCKWIKPGRW